ncbi:MAG: phosphatase PAP2 family protein [Prevotellaceae bacterium]|jgi:hypothetical protein|nr:phosphatase PAP2 family protein [Prevotellaceae bacterium]
MLKNFLPTIPDDYIIVRLLFLTAMFPVFGDVYAQTPDDSFDIRKTSTTTSAACRTANIAIPALMLTYGVVSLSSSTLKRWDCQIKTELYKKYICPNRVDNYLQFVPATAAFGMKAAEVESVNKLQDMTVIYGLSNLLETGVVYTLKTVSARMRPNGAANNSFPSGHTATAFVAAEFLHREYGDKSVWISIGGYSVATLVGASRILNNKHWFSDVVAGAGIGIFSVKIVYWVYPSLKKKFCKKEAKRMKSFVFPSYKNNALCLNLACEF